MKSVLSYIFRDLVENGLDDYKLPEFDHEEEKIASAVYSVFGDHYHTISNGDGSVSRVACNNPGCSPDEIFDLGES